MEEEEEEKVAGNEIAERDERKAKRRKTDVKIVEIL